MITESRLTLLGALSASLAFAQSPPPYTSIDYPGAVTTVLWQINNEGDIAGTYMLPDSTRHAFRWSSGRLTPIDYPGATTTETFGINSRGVMVGDYVANGVSHGLVLDHGRMITVDIPGATGGGLAAINESGAIVGAFTGADGNFHSYTILGDRITRYDYPGATATIFNYINDDGDIVGTYASSGATHGFLLSGGKATPLDYPNATLTIAYAIGPHGDIVGRYRDSAGTTHGFIYSGGKYTTLDIPGSTFTRILGINAFGDLTGGYTAGGVNHAFLMTNPAASYTVTDLGVLPGGSFSQASGGNTNTGLITGAADVADGSFHAVLWQYGQLTDLASQGPNSFGIGVNDAGVVAGEAETGDADTENFCAFESGFRCVPFLWQDGIMSQLPTLGGPNGAVSTVNNAGVAVGVAQTALRDLSCVASVAHRYQAVAWGPGPGEIRVLRPLPGDTVTVALWVNDRGQAVGTSGNCSNTLPYGAIIGPHAVLWDSDGTPRDLGSLGGTVDVTLFGVGTTGLYINDNGAVSGGAALAGNKSSHGFLWTPETGMKDLGTLAGDVASGALAVNNRNEVVGGSNSSKGDQRAFLWRNGLMTDLNTMVPKDSPLYLLVGFGINDLGEIVGMGATHEGDVHAFLATPNTGLTPASLLGVERRQSGGSMSRNARQFPRH